MAEVKELKEQINAVVEARAVLKEVLEKRMAEFQKWQEANEQLYTNEAQAKIDCREAEDQLRELALGTFAKTGDKAVAPGVGIRMMTQLAYEVKDAFTWALEHKLALEVNRLAFEKIAKMSNLPFVTITEEPSATIATELNKVE